MYKEPDAARAAWYLEHRDPANRGRGGTEGVTVSVNPAPAPPNPRRRRHLDLCSLAVQILVDNGIPLPQPKINHQGQKVSEILSTSAGVEQKAGA